MNKKETQKDNKNNKLNENIIISDINSLNNKKEDSEKNNINLVKNNDSDNKEKKKIEEKNEGFVRPSFLNLYKTDDNSDIKQKVDINKYGETNRNDNSQLKIKKN